MKTSAYCTGRIRWGNAKECALQQLLREKGLFTGSGLVSVVFGPVYFGVRRAHKGHLSSQGARIIKQWTRV